MAGRPSEDVVSDLELRQHCALCAAPHAELDEVLRLAPTPPANEFVRESDLQKPQGKIPLTLLLCRRCGHLQLAEVVSPERLFGHYVYVSGTSPVFVAHFARYAGAMCERFGLGASSFVVDIGSNDGTLLKQFQARGVVDVLGIDPAEEIAREARSAGVPTLDGFFDADVAGTIRSEYRPANLVCANNVFAHAADLGALARAVRAVLAPDGVFVFEVSYLVDVVEKLLFDTIYHEHTSYHAVAPLVRFFDSLGMRLFDAERVDAHGGSVRCFVAAKSAPHADTERLASLLAVEEQHGLSTPAVYARLKERITERGAQVRARLRELASSGKSIAGFGAPAKLTTLMHELGIDGSLVSFIVDDSPWKQGLYTPGTHIPVLASSALAERRPDVCVVFAWNFADAIIAKHSAFTQAGGRFIVPLPVLREI